MGAVHELTIRSNRFVTDFDNVIKSVITDNPDLLNLNRSQLKDEHKTKLDQPITPPYSLNYAAWKGFKTPDLFVTGYMFSKMKLRKTREGYIVVSLVDYFDKLNEKYRDAFGIAISKHPDAYRITTPLIAEQYKRKVFTK